MSDAGRESGSAGAKAANLAKAASKAASGNYVGAALDVAADKETRQVVTALVLLPAFMFMIVFTFVLYLYPMAMYEQLQGLFANAKQSFWQGFYADDGGGLSGIIRGTGGWVRTVVSAIAQAFQDTVTADYHFDKDLGVVTGDSRINTDGTLAIDTVVSDSLMDKLEQTRNKYALRVADIKTAIESQLSSGINARCKEMFTAGYRASDPADNAPDRFKGFQWDESGVLSELPYPNAVCFCALYDLLTDNNFTETSVTDYLRWLGWNAGAKNDVMAANISGQTAEISGWTGTYMPQIIVDEAVQAADKAATDAAEIAADYYEENWREYSERAESDISVMRKGYDIDGVCSADEAYDKRYKEKYAEVMEAYYSAYGVSAIDYMMSAYLGTISSEETKKEKLIGSETVDVKKSSAYIPGIITDYVDRGFRIAGEKEYSGKTVDYWLRNVLRLSYGNIIAGVDIGAGHAGTEPDVSAAQTVQSGDDLGYITLSYYEDYRKQVGWTEPEVRKFQYKAVRGKTNPFYNSTTDAAKSAYNAYKLADRYWYTNWAPTWETDCTFTYSIIGESQPIYETWVRYRFDIYKYYYEVLYNVPVNIEPRSKSEMELLSGILEGDHMEERAAANRILRERLGKVA